MEYKIKINERVYHVDAGLPDGLGCINMLLDEKARSVSVTSFSDNYLHLKVDGQAVNLFTARTTEGIWVWVDGRARLVENADKVERRKTRGPSEVMREVTPPTPAAVVRVLVEEGQKVVKGQGLVVVSAMKMEITLSAPYSGIVRAVNTNVGDQVKPGDILVEIEAHAEEDQYE
jgi:biotin carboxyl carrier protein